MIRIVTTLLGMADDRLPKRAAELREADRRRRWRLRLRWEDWVIRDVMKAGEEEYWDNKTREEGGKDYQKKRRRSTSALTNEKEEARVQYEWFIPYYLNKT